MPIQKAPLHINNKAISPFSDLYIAGLKGEGASKMQSSEPTFSHWESNYKDCNIIIF